MKNKIVSRHGKSRAERSPSNSSTKIKQCVNYKDRKECSDKHRKRCSEKEEPSRRHRSSRSSSDSNSSSGSSRESDSGSYERSSSNYRKNASYSDFKSTKNENIYDNVKIKEEPITDDEHHRYTSQNRDRSNRGRYENDTRERRRSRSRSRSWNNDRHPMKQERSSEGNHARRPIKKERFSDVEKEPRWGKSDEQTLGHDKKKPLVNKAKPDFGLSGKLAEETNTYNGVVIKYSEPPEARKPKRRWRLYPFKGDEGLPTLYIHRQSAFLIGRDRKVADLPVDHPSCSKQHAVLQYRLVPFERSDATKGKRICPYIIDLESANGTFVNNVKIEPKKYVELFEKDVLKFAFSSREYVLLHEHSKDSGDDDDM